MNAILGWHLPLESCWIVACCTLQLEDNKEDESSISCAASSTGTIGRAGIPVFRGAEDMMSEMAQRLRQRRAKTEGGSADVSRIIASSVLRMRADTRWHSDPRHSTESSVQKRYSLSGLSICHRTFQWCRTKAFQRQPCCGNTDFFAVVGSIHESRTRRNPTYPTYACITEVDSVPLKLLVNHVYLNDLYIEIISAI